MNGSTKSEDEYKEAELDDPALAFIEFLNEGLNPKTKFTDDGGSDPKLNFTDKVKIVRDKLLYKNNSDPVLLTGAENLDIIFGELGLNEAFAYDEFTQNVYQVKAFPWQQELQEKKEFSEMSFIELSYELDRLFEFRRKSLLHDAIVVHAQKNKFNIVQEFILKDEWDGKKRIDSFFIDFLGAEDCQYVREVTNMFFRAAVGRAFNPGIKYDYMLVLTGRQGLGKSSLLRKIAGNWHSPGPPNFNSKVGGEFAIAAWIIEVDELVAYKNSSLEETKTFISREFDNFRPPYGKKVERYDRKCVFIGTTNEHAFLKDRTGNRRFIPILVGENPLKRSKDELTPTEVSQLWAEAYQLYKLNSKLDYSDEIKAEAEKIRENHIYYDPYEGKIEEYLNMPRPNNWNDLLPSERYEKFKVYLSLEENQVWRGWLPTEISPIEIFNECFGKFDKQINSQQSNLIGQALLNLGWALGKQKRKRVKHYGQQKLYLKVIKKTESHDFQENQFE